MLVHVVDDHHLEIGLGQRARLGRQHRLVFVVIGLGRVAVQRDMPAAIGAGGQAAGDAVDGEGDIVVIGVLELAAQMVEGLNAGEGPIGLDQRQRLEEIGDLGLQAFRLLALGVPRKRVGCLAKFAPAVGAKLDGRIVVAHGLHRGSPFVTADDP